MYNDDYRCQCPFNKRFKDKTIVCEGVTGRSNTELKFFSSKAMDKYIKENCIENYEGCMVCQMLESKYR